MSVVEGSAIDGKFGQCKTFAIEKWEDEDACVEVGRNSGGCFHFIDGARSRSKSHSFV
jgi:hypothetical protein